MDRRQFLTTTTGAALSSLMVNQVWAVDQVKTHTNVLFIISDQFRGDALGVDDNTFVHTPNLDRLAKQGVRFSHAYCPQAWCSPARASLLTGLYPHTHGLEEVVYDVPDCFADPRYHFSQNFPSLLKQAGYTTAWFGKWHLGDNNPGFFDSWDGYNSRMSHWLGKPQESVYRPDAETAKAIEFLEKNRSVPFMLCLSFYPPHDPYDPPAKYLRQLDGKNIDHPKYYAAVSAVDSDVGRVLDQLDKLRLTDNTLVVFVSDHGETFGRRPFSENKQVCYEESIRIPLLMRCPNILPRGKVWTSGVSQIDVMPTILAIAGLPIPAVVQGRNLLKLIRTGRDRWDQPIFIENISGRYKTDEMPVERAVRTERWKLILREWPDDLKLRMDELYDLKNDPGETRSMMGCAEMSSQITKLSRMLLDWGHRYKDEPAVRMGQRYA